MKLLLSNPGYISLLVILIHGDTLSRFESIEMLAYPSGVSLCSWITGLSRLGVLKFNRAISTPNLLYLNSVYIYAFPPACICIKYMGMVHIGM